MKKLVLSLALALLIIGCGGEKSIFPITVGNDWDYSWTTIITGVYNDTMTGTQTTQIASETTLDDGTAAFELLFNMEFDDTSMTDFTDTVYIVDNDDYALVYSNKSDTDPDTQFVYPIEEGNTWTVYSDSFSTTTAVVLDKKNVTVPAGTYNDCWEIGYITNSDTNYSYFAPGTGNVKSFARTVVDTTMTTETTVELETVTIE